MTQAALPHRPVVDWLTVVAIAAIAISLNLAGHEGVHALVCLAAGSHLQEYSALYVSCDCPTAMQEKIVAGSAPIFNLLAGLLLWSIVRNSKKQAPEVWFFLWLSMLMNWLYGAGYLMFSGIANVGDMAVVIRGLEPSWLWRVLMSTAGSLLFMFLVWLALREFGKVVGGDAIEQIRRANKISLLSYATSFVVVLIAGLFSPAGLLSSSVTAALLAVIGGLSPLLWMMLWFRAKIFSKLPGPPLEIHRKWQWLTASIIVVSIYVFTLGRSLYF